MIALIITGAQTWQLSVVGQVPPGVDPALMEGTVIASYAITGQLLPFVRGQWVELHQEDVEILKAKFAKKLGMKVQ